MKYYLILALMTMTLASCDKDDDIPVVSDEPKADPINLIDLQVGQTSTFKRYKDACGVADLFHLTGDTLILKVVTENDKLYFEESYTLGSTNFGTSTPVQHEIIKHDDFILIPERANSSLFFFYGNDTLYTNPEHDVNLTQGVCVVEYENGEPFVGDEIGLIDEYHIESIHHGENTIISCVPPFMELDAYLLYFNGRLNLSESISYLEIMPQVTGFSLITD